MPADPAEAALDDTPTEGIDSMLSVLDEAPIQHDKEAPVADPNAATPEPKPKPEGQVTDPKAKPEPEPKPTTAKDRRAQDSNYRTLESQRDEARREADKFKKQWEELDTRSKAPNPDLERLKADNAALAKERDELRAKAEDLGKTVALKAVEETDRFRDGVTKPRQAADKEIGDIVKAHPQLDVNVINGIISHSANRYERSRKLDLYLNRLMVPVLDHNDKPVLKEDGEPEMESLGFLHSDLKEQMEKYVQTWDVEKQIREEQKGNRDLAIREQQEKDASTRLKRQDDWKAGHESVSKKISTKLKDLLEDKGLDKDGKDAPIKDLFDKALKDAGEMDSHAFDNLSPEERAYYHIAGRLFVPLLMSMRRAWVAERTANAKRNGSSTASIGRGAAPSGEEPTDDHSKPGLAGLFDKIDSMPS